MGRPLCIWLENGDVGFGGIMQEAVKGHAEEDKAI
jgi:hypothetical protein